MLWVIILLFFVLAAIAAVLVIYQRASENTSSTPIALRSIAKPEPSVANTLLKEATQLKKNGDIEAACEKLREAYSEIAKGDIIYSIDTFLRLPLYLQKAGRKDDAWREFNKLIVQGYPNQMRDLKLRFMDHSKVYDKMRLHLQREKNFVEAINFGILSVVSWETGLYLQGRLEERIRKEQLEDSIMSLVKKANLEDRLKDIADAVWNALKDTPKVDHQKLKDTVSVICGNN